MTEITAELRALAQEVAKDPVAEAMLRAKCNWEFLGRYAVLVEWGDPRKWPGYQREVEATHE